MDAAIDQHQFAAPHDPVELGYLMARMKTPSTRRNLIMAAKIREAAAVGAPFIGVAHQDGGVRRGVAIILIDMMLHSCCLPPPPKPGEVKVHADSPQANAAHIQRCHDGTARLEAGQVDDMRLDMRLIAPHQHRIAVPSHAFRSGGKGNGAIIRVHLQHPIRQHCVANAKAQVSFLQRDHIGVDLIENIDDSFRGASAVRADAFVNIVRGHFDHRP